MGGSWDATNVADAAVAVVLPIARRPRAATSATRRPPSPSRRPGSSSRARSRCSPSSRPRSPRCCSRRAAEVGAHRRPRGPGVRRRRRGSPAVGGQLVSLQGLRARYDEVFLPLYGAHQAQNAAVALAAVEAFARRREPLDDELVRAAFAEVDLARAGWRSSGAARRSCSTPRTTRTAPRRAAAALEDSFAFSPLIGVIGVMADKDARGRAGRARAAPRPRRLHPELHRRGRCPPSELAVAAREVFGEDRVSVAPRLADAIDQAAALAEAGEAFGDPLGSGAVLVTGSVVTVGEARHAAARAAAMSRRVSAGRSERSPAPRHVRRDPLPRGDHARPDHPGDGLGRRRRPRHRAAGRPRARRSPACCWPGCCAREWAYALGLGDPGRRDRARASWSR